MMSNRSNTGSLGTGDAAIDFNCVKVFSATMFGDRAELGEKVTHWLADHRDIDVSDIVVTQSSDASFHCLAITVFYKN